MGTAAKPTRANPTITIDFRNEATYFRLLEEGKAFLEFVFAFSLSMSFQLTHKATCGGGGDLTRHSHYVRVGLPASVAGANDPYLEFTTGQRGGSFRISKHIVVVMPVTRHPPHRPSRHCFRESYDALSGDERDHLAQRDHYSRQRFAVCNSLKDVIHSATVGFRTVAAWNP